MLKVCVLSLAIGAALAGYSESPSNKVGGNGAYGFSGSFSGTDGNAPSLPFPGFPGFPSFDFNSYFDSFKKYQEQFINTKTPNSFALSYSSPNANAQAQSSITFKSNGLQEQAKQVALQSGQNPAPGLTSYGEGKPQDGGFQGTDGSAIAAASIGPKGGFHTAAVYPENPNAPNIFSRFAETAPDGKGENFGVFTSSFSSSSNVDGKPQTFRQASTTINDNGKISTYTVKNP